MISILIKVGCDNIDCLETVETIGTFENIHLIPKKMPNGWKRKQTYLKGPKEFLYYCPTCTPPLLPEEKLFKYGD